MNSEEAIYKFLDMNLCICLIFDNSGKISYLNRTAMEELGYDGENIRLEDIFYDMKGRDITEFINGEEIRDIDISVYRKNKTCFPAHVRFGYIDIGEGINVALASNLYNEKEAKLALEKTELDIKEVTKFRNEFVANITHELRTPVNGIKGHVKNLLMQGCQSDDKKTLEIIEQCCLNMEKIINNLLDFSKIEAGKFTLDQKPFNLREVVNLVMNTSITIANEKDIKLSAIVSENVPDIVTGDELRIIQILNNLVSNAVKFTDIGYVKLEVYKTMQLNNQVELSFLVIDTGLGINKEEQEKLFKSFSQVDASATRKYGGTGLGLSVSKQLVELMRGSISVESEKGKGSTFIFSVLLGTENSKNNIVENEIRKDILLPIPESIDDVYVYGSSQNRDAAKSNIEKLIVSVEMGAWEKAELFAGNLKRLFEGADPDINSLVFKLQMAVRKEDYTKTVDLFKKLNEITISV